MFAAELCFCYSFNPVIPWKSNSLQPFPWWFRSGKWLYVARVTIKFFPRRLDVGEISWRKCMIYFPWEYIDLHGWFASTESLLVCHSGFIAVIVPSAMIINPSSLYQNIWLPSMAVGWGGRLLDEIDYQSDPAGLCFCSCSLPIGPSNQHWSLWWQLQGYEAISVQGQNTIMHI